ncbi:MAG: phosphatase PAP2 family protein [Sphingomicrobium sp.]
MLGAALAVLAALWLAMLLGGGGWLDRTVYEALYAGHRPLLATAARLLTVMGDPAGLVVATVLAALGLRWLGHKRLPWIFLAIALVGRGLADAQKYAVARVRPDAEAHLVVVKTSSFPSGHAANSMIFYLALALILTAGTRWHRPAAVGALLLSLLIGTSRVMLGVHWPSDVIGGWAFGCLWVLLTLRLAERVIHAAIGTDT